MTTPEARTPPAQRTPLITILGVGNPLRGDDGVGVHVLGFLLVHAHFSPNVRLLDGGTLGMRLVGPILESNKLIVIDSAFMGQPPGTVARLTREMWTDCIQTKHSLHEVSFLETLALAGLVGDLPTTIIIGVEPANLSNLAVGLSPDVKRACSTVVEMVLAEVSASGGEARVLRPYRDSFDPRG
jgi:hydrogenase maturation protease